MSFALNLNLSAHSFAAGDGNGLDKEPSLAEAKERVRVPDLWRELRIWGRAEEGLPLSIS